MPRGRPPGSKNKKTLQANLPDGVDGTKVLTGFKRSPAKLTELVKDATKTNKKRKADPAQASPPPPTKKGRGRPPKVSGTPKATPRKDAAETATPKRAGGSPRKTPDSSKATPVRVQLSPTANKKGQGRPPKASGTPKATPSKDAADIVTPKRGRGRPPKTPNASSGKFDIPNLSLLKGLEDVILDLYRGLKSVEKDIDALKKEMKSLKATIKTIEGDPKTPT